MAVYKQYNYKKMNLIFHSTPWISRAFRIDVRHEQKWFYKLIKRFIYVFSNTIKRHFS